MTNQQVRSCQVEGCARPYRAKGYCGVHYKKWRRGGLPHPRYKTCYQEGCRKKVFLKSFCEEHYKALYGKKEEAQSAPPSPPPPETASPEAGAA